MSRVFSPVTVAYRGALVKPNADITTVNATSGYTVVHDAESYDTDAIHDNATNNTRLTVPAGVTRVRLSANVDIALASNDDYMEHQILKGGIGNWDGAPDQLVEVGLTLSKSNITSAVVTVVAGDYFEQKIVIQSDTSVTIDKDRTWFAMEIIE